MTIAAVLCLVAVVLYFARRYTAVVAVAGLTVVVLLVYKLVFNLEQVFEVDALGTVGAKHVRCSIQHLFRRLFLRQGSLARVPNGNDRNRLCGLDRLINDDVAPEYDTLEGRIDPAQEGSAEVREDLLRDVHRGLADVEAGRVVCIHDLSHGRDLFRGLVARLPRRRRERERPFW